MTWNIAGIADLDWASILGNLQTIGLSFGGKLLLAILIFYVGRIVARILTRGARKLMQAQEVDKILETFVCNMIYWLIMVFVIIAAINQIGIETTSLIAVMGAAGLAVGLALQGSLSNFAAGVLIVIFRPYRVGDFVEAAGISGAVVQVQILTTILKNRRQQADRCTQCPDHGQHHHQLLGKRYAAHRPGRWRQL